MTAQPASLTFHDLACERGGLLVFAGISGRAGPGECLALTGPNGAGKSSLLRVLAGLVPKTAGEIRFEPDDGAPPVHLLGHADGIMPALTLRETLRYWSRLYASPADEDALFLTAEAVGLAHALDLSCGILSAGQRRRAALARLRLAPRPVWLLDEPTAALDAAGEALLGTMMRDHLAAGGAIVAATHQSLPVSPDATLRMAA